MNVTSMYNEVTKFSLLFLFMYTNPVKFFQIVSHPSTTEPFNASLSFGYNTWWDTITDSIDYLKDTVELSLSNNVVSTTNNVSALPISPFLF